MTLILLNVQRSNNPHSTMVILKKKQDNPQKAFFLFCIHFLNNSHVLFCILNPVHFFLQNGDAKPRAEGFFSV